MIYLEVVLLVFTLGVYWASWICKLMFSINTEKFSTISSKFFYPCSFLLSSGTPITWIWITWYCPLGLWNAIPFFLQSFLFFPLGWMLSVDLSSIYWSFMIYENWSPSSEFLRFQLWSFSALEFPFVCRVPICSLIDAIFLFNFLNVFSSAHIFH